MPTLKNKYCCLYVRPVPSIFWLFKANMSVLIPAISLHIVPCMLLVLIKFDNVTVVWLTFMSCGCANTDHSTVWAKGCGCQSVRASWCHQWNCQSIPSPAVRQTCWLQKIQGRSGQSDSEHHTSVGSGTLWNCFLAVWSICMYSLIYTYIFYHFYHHLCLYNWL